MAYQKSFLAHSDAFRKEHSLHLEYFVDVIVRVEHSDTSFYYPDFYPYSHDKIGLLSLWAAPYSVSREFEEHFSFPENLWGSELMTSTHTFYFAFFFMLLS